MNSIPPKPGVVALLRPGYDVTSPLPLTPFDIQLSKKRAKRSSAHHQLSSAITPLCMETKGDWNSLPPKSSVPALLKPGCDVTLPHPPLHSFETQLSMNRVKWSSSHHLLSSTVTRFYLGTKSDWNLKPPKSGVLPCSDPAVTSPPPLPLWSSLISMSIVMAKAEFFILSAF